MGTDAARDAGSGCARRCRPLLLQHQQVEARAAARRSGAPELQRASSDPAGGQHHLRRSPKGGKAAALRTPCTTGGCRRLAGRRRRGAGRVEDQPAWCQPWTIVTTGLAIVSSSFLVFHSCVFTGVVAVPIAAWWYIFLAVYPTQYAQLVLQTGAVQSEQAA